MPGGNGKESGRNVMNNRWKKTVVSFLMMLLAVLCFSVHTDAAAYGKIDQETTLYAWPLSKADLRVFSDEELTQESDQVSYRRFEITELTDSYAKVKYKEGKRKRVTLLLKNSSTIHLIIKPELM